MAVRIVIASIVGAMGNASKAVVGSVEGIENLPAATLNITDEAAMLFNPCHLQLGLQIVGNLLAVEASILDEYLARFGT